MCVISKTTFEDYLIKPIYDNVHGFIYLTENEKKLLENPYFQRLNFIKQNGLANFVFPGSTHTRFSHSLGVLHITEMIIQQIKKTKKITLTNKEHQIIRLAALLHDIGHYPLSHTIEASYFEYYPTINDPADIKHEIKDITNNDVDLFTFLKNYHKDESLYHHEKISEKIINTDYFKNLLLNTFQLFDLNEDDIFFIGHLISRDVVKIDTLTKYTQNNNNAHIFLQLIKSNFDADQMDYMIRDTFNTGVKSSIRLDFILDNIDICRKKYSNDNIKERLCYNIRSIQSIEQFLLSKYYWYTEILFYEKVAIVNLIAQRLNTLLLLKGHNFFNNTNISQSIENKEHFFFYNDSYFWNNINKIITGEIEDIPPLAKKLAKMLIYKKFPKIIGPEDFEKIFDTNNNFISYSSKVYDQINNIDKEKENYYTKVKNHNNNYFPFLKEYPIFKVDDIDDNHITDKSLCIAECQFSKKCTKNNLANCSNWCGDISNLDNNLLNAFTFKEKNELQKLELDEEINTKSQELSSAIDNNQNEDIKNLNNKLKELKSKKNNLKPKSKSKTLYIFRIYDFENILDDPNLN